VCCVAAIGLWSSRSQEAPGPSTKHPNFWPQQLEEDGNLAEKVVSGPMHAGDGGRVSNPFEVAYSHPNDPPLNAHTLWTKWSHRIDSAFVTAADFGNLADMTGYKEMEKLPHEGVVQGANLPQSNFLRMRNHEEMPDRSKMFGPKDKMVPAAEYVDSPHNTGWGAQTYEGVSNYLAHLHGNRDYKSFWDTADYINAALGDQVVKQDTFEKEDGHGNQGRQWGGVLVDWRTVYHQVKQEPGSNLKDIAPHFAHRSDGSVHLEMPTDSTLPYRAEVPTTIFRPCEKHPFKGCAFEPPMHVPAHEPAALPPTDAKEVNQLLGEEEGPGPEEFVDQEDERFNKKLFGLAAKFEGDSSDPISAADVEQLVKTAVETSGTDWIQEKMNVNVFKYVLANYECGDAAKSKIRQILSEAAAASGSGDKDTAATGRVGGGGSSGIEGAMAPIAKALGAQPDSTAGDNAGDAPPAPVGTEEPADSVPEAQAEAQAEAAEPVGAVTDAEGRGGASAPPSDEAAAPPDAPAHAK